jgi:hypothetical protein
MDVAARRIHAGPSLVVFEDGLGQRFHLPEAEGAPASDVLALRSSFAMVPSFEFALRDQASRLATFRHSSYAPVRGIERGGGMEPTIRVVSAARPGIRLSDLLSGAQARRVPIDIHAALSIVQQLVQAVALLHERVGETGHGAIAPERLVVTPQARLVVADYVLGAALEQLRYSRERYWRELRIPLPSGPTAPRFDANADVLQVGVVALSLILGRPLRAEEFPARLADMVASAWATSSHGGFEPLPPGLRGWLGRALQLDPTRTFPSAIDARAELDAVLGDGELLASPASLEAFLSRCDAEADLKVGSDVNVKSAPVPSAPPPPVPPVRVVAAPAPLAPAAGPPERTEPEACAPHGTRTVVESPTRGNAAAGWQGRRDWRPVVAATAIVAVLVAGGSIAARRPQADPPAPDSSGSLALSTSPAGVEVWLDGEKVGETPIGNLTVPAGTHDLVFRHPELGERHQTVVVTAKEPTRLSVDLSAK